MQDNVIEGNRILGAEGVGIELLHASRNQIVNNTISSIAPRDPFPGNTLGPPPAWREANGAGVWVSPGSDENEIAGNTFEDVASHAIVLEGDRNVVETRGEADRVRDLGTGNRISPPVEAGRLTGFATGADGVRLSYRIEGGGGDTVVVLHGGPALGLAYLAPDLEPLGREHTLLFYDQRGVGRSWGEPDVDLSVDRHIEDLEALRSHFGIGRLRLAGHSWGAMLAARYAAAYPERVERMLFIDPMVPAKTYEAEAGSVARRLMQERLDSVSLAVLDSLVRTAPEAPDPHGHCRMLFELLVPLYYTDAAAAHRSRGDFCTGSDEAIRARSHVSAAILGSLGDDVRPLLSRVRSPVLIVHGGSGAIPTAAMQAWADALPDARLMVIPDAGHYLHVDRPDVFFPAALEFLRGSWPAGADLHSAGAGATRVDTVHVAPPTGERDADRASIHAALERVQPGGVVQFPPGTYFMGGAIIRVTVPGITLQGHPDGTTLRGCDPGEFPWEDITEFGNNCNAIELAAGQQTVRDLTFEHLFWALHVGCCWDAPEMRGVDGGHLIEGNTFRSSSNAVRVHGFWSEPTVIRNNRFLNNWHSVAIYGNTVHLLDNDISVPEPEAVQLLGFPMEGVHLARPFDLHESVEGVGRTCENNVIAGNRIDGVTEGILVTANEAGIVCRNNVIRDNTIAVRRAHPPAMPGFIPVHDPGDSTVIGVPLALRGLAGERTLEDNLVEGNVIVGAEGLGIEIRSASRNRIANNTVTRVVRREPFPGNSMAALPILGGNPEGWRQANGSSIWISPGSDENEIVGNTFEDIASHAIVLEGDRNRVETRTPANSVRDLGSGNQVSVRTGPLPGDTGEQVDVLVSADDIAALTARYVEFLNDEWAGGAGTLFAPDATLALGDGVILEGRDAIVRDFFRPTVARIRGLVPTSSEVIEGEQRVTVLTTYSARFAPAPDSVRGSFSNTWARQPDASWLIAAATFDLSGWQDDGASAPGIRSGFFETDGLRLHYLDSGGDGVPLLFMPVRDRTAYSFIEFAERFTDRHRVLSLTSRGTGQSAGELEDVFSAANAARDAVALLDALQIERAVVVPAWSADIGIILGNLHPDRLAGLIFSNGPPTPDLFELLDADSTGMLAMASRLYFSVDGLDPDESLRQMRARHEEEAAPDRRLDAPIRVPALAFVGEMGTADVEGWWETDLGIARWVADDPGMVGDAVSREFFLKLASDEQLQESVRVLYRDFVAPRYRAVERAFASAFGSCLRLAPVEATGIGYGYRDAPDMIYPHIRRFLDDVNELERCAVSTEVDTIHVAPPTGERDADRSSILAALALVQPGGTLQFAPGMYAVGALIPVATPRITLLGHPQGTTLRGCEPTEYAAMAVEADRTTGYGERWAIVSRCGTFEMTGGHGTIRGLTFEYTTLGLVLGCCYAEGAFRPSEGGYLVEGNTFRDSGNGVRPLLSSADTTLIRNNRFINTFHAVSAVGSRIHVTDNEISVPEPRRVPGRGHPGFGIGFSPGPALPTCEDNIIADNRVEGHETGIVLFADPDTICRANIIRDNTIIVRRVPLPAAGVSRAAVDITAEADSTIVGVPVTLHNPTGEGRIEDNVIEGNRILGAAGIGIEVLHASMNRIIGNTIMDVARRDPFPGNTLGGNPERWELANGSGIWVSRGSDENEIVGNTFQDVAAPVVLEGDRNRVETRSASDVVRDLGSGNRITGAATAISTSMAPGPGTEPAEVLRVLASGPSPPPSQGADSSSIRMIRVDGHAIRFLARGLAERAAGQPVVVFEGGSSSPIEGWTGVLDALGEDVPAVAYDPPGLGGSDWDEVEPYPDRVAERLRRVLAAAGVEPPYVLVGHSWEAYVVRAFEGMYTGDVAGMVLIDPTPPGTGRWFRSAFDDIGAGPGAPAELRSFLNTMVAGAPLPVRRRQAVIDEYEVAGTDPDVPSAPSVPVVVLAAGRFDAFEMPPGVTLSFDMGAFFAALRTRDPGETWGRWVGSAPDGMLVYAAGLPHCMHCADPGLVAWAIRRVSASAVRDQPTRGGEP
jgi:parallel beta-helix repeat protein